MPNDYDVAVMGEAYFQTSVPGYTPWTKQVRIGGGSRSWGGVQSRQRPDPLTVTACKDIIVKYFDTRQMRVLDKGKFVYFDLGTSLYGRFNEYSVDDARGESIARLRANQRLASGHLNILVAVGESRETVRYVANRGILLYRTLNDIRRGRFSDAASRLKVGLSQNASKRLERQRRRATSPADLLANSWLEYSFAIRPLMADAYGAVEAYHSKMQAGDAVRATARYKAGPKGTVYKAGVLGRVRSPESRTLQQLGVTNPLLAAWELVPLSFVVDWFLPIGSYLSYMDSTLGLDVQSWHSTLRWWNIRVKDKSGPIERRTTTYNRDRLNGWIPPVPVVGGNLNTQMLITANALLQRVSR